MPKQKRELVFNTANGHGAANSYNLKGSFESVKVKTAFNKEKRELRFPMN